MRLLGPGPPIEPFSSAILFALGSREEVYVDVDIRTMVLLAEHKQTVLPSGGPGINNRALGPARLILPDIVMYFSRFSYPGSAIDTMWR